MTVDVEDSSTPPEWMIALENKQKRHHKLAHDIGAGALCLNCNDGCTGLDLHFWRKICRNCKCKKEEHDVKDENAFEHFEILFGDNLKHNDRVKKLLTSDLKLKLQEILATKTASIEGLNTSSTKTDNDLSFDWIPADVPANLASEYLQQLPLEKLPITGSAGAVFRRQQLQKQIPLHDFKVNNCHDLTEEETVAFSEYLDNLKTHAVGKGQITKISLQQDIPTGQLKLPMVPTNLNSSPKPFRNYIEKPSTIDEDLPPPPPEFLLPDAADLKTPSAFVPHRKPTLAYPTKSEIMNNNVPYLSENLNGNKLLESSKPVDGLVDEYSKKLNVNGKDAQNNNWHKNDDRFADQENKLTPFEIIRKLNTHRIPEKCCSPIMRQRNNTSPSKNVDGKFIRVTNPAEESVVVSPYVPNVPQPSNALGSRNMNCSPKDRFGSPPSSDSENQLHPELSNLIVPESGCELACHQCKQAVLSGQVVVVAERAGVEVIWHPQCFVCVICQELLVDLVYFFKGGEIYCGRHYAEVMKIPRCYACDELIFLKEYTVAENQTFHVKHFCCFECDEPLAGKLYIPKDDNPVCLPCYEAKYGKKCHFCDQSIKAGDSRVGWNDLSWHAMAACFKCIECYKSLLGGRFVVRNENPLCSKECVARFDARVK